MEENHANEAAADTPEAVYAALEKWTPRLLKLVGFKDAHRLALTDVVLKIAQGVKETNERAARGEASARRSEALLHEIAKRSGIDSEAVLRGVQ